MDNRRSFLAGVVGASLVTAGFREDAVARAARAGDDAGKCPADELAGDEAYWSEIQRCFDTDRTVINLNNGGVCPTPGHVLEHMIRDLRFTNESPVQHMWRILEPRVESVRRDLAREFGCDAEEIAITRNASEAMETLIFGIDLNRGDEVIITDQNYPRMITSWEQRGSPRGDRRQEDLLPDPARESARLRRSHPRGDHPPDAGHRVPPHHQPLRADPAGPRRRAAGQGEGDRGLHRRRPRLRPLPVQARRPRMRLLRLQPAQVAAGADRDRVPLHPQAASRSGSGR